MVSIQVLAIPMIGFRRSSSVKPMDFIIARAPARELPSYSVLLLARISTCWSVLIDLPPHTGVIKQERRCTQVHSAVLVHFPPDRLITQIYETGVAAGLASGVPGEPNTGGSSKTGASGFSATPPSMKVGSRYICVA